MGDVTKLDMITKLPIPVENVLAAAVREHEEDPFDRVIVIAMRRGSSDEYFATSESDVGTHLYDLARLKRRLMWEADKRVSESS